LKDIYFAERKILKTLPKLAKAAKSEELKSAFLTHRDETEGGGVLGVVLVILIVLWLLGGIGTYGPHP
jgi:Domain of unknown function (DUF892)